MATSKKRIRRDSAEYRPASYWKIADPLKAILANVSGQARRQMIRDYWALGNVEALNEELLKDDLDENVRFDLGRIHPFFMGGEYLPARLYDEVTIVRINLQSTTFDVIELRARRIPGGKIGLRWVDEYETEFTQPVQEVECPFSFVELIEFISQSGPGMDDWGRFPLCYNVLNYDLTGNAEELRDFTSFDSDFYPGLCSWCASEVDKWINLVEPPYVEEEEDEEEEEEEVST